MGRITTTREIDIDLTTVVAEGQLEAEDFLGWLREYYSGTVTELVLWDFTDADISQISDDGFEEIVKASKDRDKARAWGKTALVFDDEDGYKKGKDYVSLSESRDMEFEIQVFKDMSAARSWLGLEQK